MSKETEKLLNAPPKNIDYNYTYGNLNPNSKYTWGIS